MAIFKFKRQERDEVHTLGSINFDRLVGHEYDLYYYQHLNQFQLGRVIFEVLEDENDGYRSSMDHVEVISTSAPLRQKLATIMVTKWETDDMDTFILIDKDGHRWLEFGTNYQDSYYPCFVFHWQAKKSE
jgi:hypothetical protein